MSRLPQASIHRLAAALVLFLSPIAGSLAVAEPEASAETLQAVELETLNEEIASQQTINRLDAETRQMRDEYWTLLARQQQLARREQALTADLKRQAETLKTLRRQLRRVPPDADLDAFLRQLLEALEAFVRADLPFQRAARLKRVEQLGLLLERPDATPAERLRQILLAYQQELDYGRDIEAYDGELIGDLAATAADGTPESEVAGEQDRQAGERPWVTYLRYGRVALVYQHLDGERGGWWDREAGGWRPLQPALNREVRRAIRIARKQMPPDLVLAPLRK